MLKRIATVLTVSVGCILSPEASRSDAPGLERYWLRWLVGPSDEIQKENQSRYSEGLVQAPGKVFVWGGTYGKTARQIHGVGESVLQVATGNGFGATLDDRGKVRAFMFRNGTEIVQDIRVLGRAKAVAVREEAREVVILDSAGRVHVSRGTGDVFEPAEILEGVVRRSCMKRVRCGKRHCVAVTDRGGAVAWGTDNSHGQLGTAGGKTEGTDPVVPCPVNLPDGVVVKDVACGDRHTIFLDEKGKLYSVGDDRWAQLGISAEPWLSGHEKASGRIRKALLLEDLAGCAIAGGGQHSVLLVKDGTVFTFGFNRWGQLGHHNYSSLGPPSPIADYTVRAVAVFAGENHTCIVKENGELWCIGANEHGQLGVGTLQPSMTWKKVKVSRRAIKPSHVYCTGSTCAVVLCEHEETDGS